MKNAYDADATAVLVRFVSPLEAGQGRVQIIDTGHGMTLETLRGAWMEPATEWKRSRPRSERYGRRVLGEKGLGRFAAARIADHFYVTSRRPGEAWESRVLLDWSEFDTPDRYLDEIEVQWEVTRPKEILPGGPIEDLLRRVGLLDGQEFSSGTLLSLEKLRRDWSADDLRAVQRALSRMVSPFSGEVSDSFAIYLQAPPEHSEFSGHVRPPDVFSQPEYIIQGEVAADGSCTLEAGRPGALKPISKRFILKGERAPQCGPFEIKLRAWSRDDRTLKLLAAQMETTVREIRQDLDAITGVYLYRDGFRILPYGEPGTDWLGLDLRRVQNPKMRFSNNQLSWHVFIARDRNPLLVDQSNREGLFDNQASRDLRELLIHVITELENIRDDDRPKTEKVAAKQVGLFEGFDLSSVRDAVKTRYPADREMLKIVDDSQRQLDEKVERVKTVLSRYQRLSSLGSLVDMVLHEGRQPVFNIRQDADDLRARLERATPETLPHLVQGILSGLEQIDKSADLLSAIFRRLDPFSGRQRGRPRDVVLEEVIRDGVALVETTRREVGAEITLPTSNTVVRVDPADIQTVIRNLVENSLHWLRQVPRDRRAVRIDVHRPQNGNVEIEVSDSGPGVPEGDRERIWDAYFTRKPDGTGLGLAIAGDIVKDVYDGQLDLVEEGALPGATFRIILRKRVG